MNVVQLPRRFVRSHWGGIETAILETSKEMRRRGHSVSICCPNALADRDEEEMEGIPVQRHPYFYPYLGLCRAARHQMDLKGGNMFSFALMSALMRVPHLDLIHLYTGRRPGGIGRFVARRRGIPYVVSLQGGVLDMPATEAASLQAPSRCALDWGSLLGWWVGSRRVLQDAAAVLCMGRREQALVQARHPRQRVVYVPNGVDPHRFARGDGLRFRARWNIAQDARVLLTVARIDPQKNQLFLLDELPHMLTQSPRTHLVMVGHVTSPSYHARLLQAIERNGLERHATIIDGLEASGHELVDSYHAADVFVLPSRHEPFGIVLLEAWAAGLPVVAARVGGIPDFVRDGVDGLLYAPDDRLGLHEALSRLDDTARAVTLAEAGRQRAFGEFSWSLVTRRILDVYEEVVSDAAASPSGRGEG